MPENVRRWNAALLAMQLGYGGMKIAGEISGFSQSTLHKARQELESGQVDWNDPRQRRPGGGRKPIEQTHPEVLNDLKKRVRDNRASRQLATAMGKKGHDISHVTVIRLLKKRD